MAWSTQWDGKAGIHESKNNLRGGVWSTVTHAHCSYCVYNREILFWIVVLNKACHTNLSLSLTPFCKTTT
jgi:hypothetical protein